MSMHIITIFVAALSTENFILREMRVTGLPTLDEGSE